MSEKINEIEFFPWNENFETNIKEIDEQHKVLVDLLNKLGNALTDENHYKMEKIFDELAKYSSYHFYCEELVWKKHFGDDSDLIKSHKKAHDSFLPKVLEIREKNKDVGLHIVLEEILMFLIKWLAFHILDDDKRIAYIIMYMNEGHNISESTYKTDVLMSGSMKKLIENILSMYNSLSSKAIDLIKERKLRLKAEEELKKINKKLQKISITDQLTSLYNRRHFEEVFDSELKRCARDKKYLGVILFDIDYFKKLNDTYGHQRGDLVLKLLSKAIKEVTRRPSDYAFRVGGEEFCIIISSQNKEEVYSLAKILQEKIKELKIENKNSLIGDYLTISIGLHSLIPNKNDDIDSIISIVDKNLYKAKDNGRNCIVQDEIV